MIAILLFGLLLGMRHALEADHVAAVATLVSNSSGPGDAVRQGVAWGAGHTVTLFLFGSLVIWMDGVIPEQLAHGLELLVGVMLVVLGVDVLRRLYRNRVHFHVHHHDDGNRHFHAHSHSGEAPADHDPGRHEHVHRPLRLLLSGFPLRALCIGLMHGMAGSAALILLTLETVRSPWSGMAYMALFGLGSIVGMALLSVIIAIPLQHSARGIAWVHNGLQIVVGGASILLGLGVMVEILALGGSG